MTNPENSHREELRKILEYKLVKCICSEGHCSICDKRITELLSFLEDKVILKSELLSVEEIENLIWDSLGTDEESERNYQLNTLFGDKIKPLAQQIHDRQEGK